MEAEGKRLNKYLSECGYCSRRKADEFIERGRITINGNVAKLGDKVMPGDVVMAGNKEVKPDDELILLAFNKPRGVTCTAYRGDENNIMDYINYGKKLQYIGRLDKNSEGLLLLTNDGDISNAISKSRNEHEKEYIVTVDKDITDEFVEQMISGVHISDPDTGEQWVTKPCKITTLGKNTFSLTLTQGIKRQIRRMCEKLGYKVYRLRRIRVMNIKLGSLPLGQYRELTPEEISELKTMLGMN